MKTMKMTALHAAQALKKHADSKNVAILQKFFKTEKGGYGEGDLFCGVTVPQTRLVAKSFLELELAECQRLLQSRIHEERLLSLIILSEKMARSSEREQKRIYALYTKNLRFVNNWDLVDASAHLIVGAYLSSRDRKPLFKLASSKNLWKKRVAMIACFYFIRERDHKDALKIAEILLTDTHDLIHKAVGWMLREIGKRDLQQEEIFLRRHYKKMPRTMLRYAIEKFPEQKRQAYLKAKI